MAELPTIVEPISFEQTFQKKLNSFTTAYQAQVPDFKTPTPADPVYHIIAEIALSELIGSQRISQAGLAQLLKYSKDLEFLFKSKVQPGETYEDFAERMINGLGLVSTAGTAAQYKALTFLYGILSYKDGDAAKIAKVRGAYVQAAGQGQLLVHLLTNTDRPDLNTLILDKLAAVFKGEEVRPALDSVFFQLANAVRVPIQGVVYLKPGYTVEYQKTLEETFRARWEQEKVLGWQPTTSWVVKELHQTGVKSVLLTNPSTDTPVAEKEYAAIDRIELVYVEATK